MIYLTRRESFSAAHRLFKNEWSDEQNFEVFEKCSNPNWHGHNCELFVSLKGETNPETGIVLHLQQLSTNVKEHAIDKRVHKNFDLNFLLGKITFAENSAVWGKIIGNLNQLN
jgi:6-pyruvoyltetrahydropterin/6-carboxytetrahydropterin synthase